MVTEVFRGLQEWRMDQSRRQFVLLEEEGVSKERKALRKNKIRQDKMSVSTSF